MRWRQCRQERHDHVSFAVMAGTVPLEVHLRSSGADLDIGEVAKRAGIPASTLRFYEEKGLVASVGRHGLRRQFDRGVLERLALIALGRSAGFRSMRSRACLRPTAAHVDRRAARAKADELDATIRKLTPCAMACVTRRSVRAPSHMECPTFRRLIGIAGTRKRR